MKIVLDTNVLVSGLLKRDGNPAQVVALVLGGAIQVCHDARILAEYTEVLHRPRFKFNPHHVRAVLSKIRADGLSVRPRVSVRGLPDTDDAPFLEVALSCGADYLVTGNIAHFPPDRRHGVVVLTPAQFIHLWHQQHPA
ncbi:MAG: putative toxin-antitoxin system toxin component, PIN family [Verrucomicrobia bacterium]|nr:putative toxin-antitoxin system toxin component, PIN family [Verrucomicrobiota bacterium]